MSKKADDAVRRVELRQPYENPMSAIKAVAFDLFGTLVQIGQPKQPFARLLERLGLAPAEAKALRRFIMTKDKGLAGVANALGGHISLAQLAEIESDLYAELASVSLFPETLAVLDTLRTKGVKIGIASNLAAPYAIPVQTLLPPLDVAVWSFRVGAVKPEPAFFQQVIDGFGCEASEILMVGDNGKNDVVGALAAGLQARLIHRAEPREPESLATLWDVLPVVVRSR